MQRNRLLISLWLLCFLFVACKQASLSETSPPRSLELPSPSRTGTEELVATADGSPILLSEFLFFLRTEMTGQEVQSGGLIDWGTMVDGKPMDELLKERALEAAVISRVTEIRCAEFGLEFTEEDRAQIAAYLKYEVDAVGGRAIFNKMLENYGLTEEQYIRYTYCAPSFRDKLYNHLVGEEGLLRPGDEEVRAYFHEYYARASYLMMIAVDEEGNPLPENQRDEPRRAMLGFERQVQTGSDLSDLIREYGDNYGTIDDPVDMYFAPGTMETIFDEALFSLSIGETSKVVETKFAFYLIRRLPLEDAYLEENIETVRYACSETRYHDALTEWVSSVDIAFTSAYNELKPQKYYANG